MLQNRWTFQKMVLGQPYRHSGKEKLDPQHTPDNRINLNNFSNLNVKVKSYKHAK